MSMRDIQRRLEKLEAKSREHDPLEELSDDELDAMIQDLTMQLSKHPDTSTETKDACLELIEAHEAGANTQEAEKALNRIILAELAADGITL